MSASAYVPDRRDLVWLEMDPQTGREQAGRRPAVVLSRRAYNAKVGLAVFCPVTSRVKGYAFEVALPVGLPVQSMVLADQVKSLDWRQRRAEFIGVLPRHVLNVVLTRVRVVLD